MNRNEHKVITAELKKFFFLACVYGQTIDESVSIELVILSKCASYPDLSDSHTKYQIHSLTKHLLSLVDSLLTENLYSLSLPVSLSLSFSLILRFIRNDCLFAFRFVKSNKVKTVLQKSSVLLSKSK